MPMTAARRRKLVLQIFDPEVAELKERADAFLALNGAQRLALIAEEFIDLYKAESQKDVDFAAAMKKGITADKLMAMPHTDPKIQALFLGKASLCANSLIHAEVGREGITQRFEAAKLYRNVKPEPSTLSVLEKTQHERNWKPGATA